MRPDKISTDYVSKRKKLTAKDLEIIRKRYDALPPGRHVTEQLAKEFDVANETVRKILKRLPPYNKV